MAYQFRFQKSLELKENEKDQTLTEYRQSVSEFETVAEKLYENMSKKRIARKRQRIKAEMRDERSGNETLSAIRFQS